MAQTIMAMRKLYWTAPFRTIGNLSGSFPNYVVSPPKDEAGDKRYEIIIRVQRQNIRRGKKFISRSATVGQITTVKKPFA